MSSSRPVHLSAPGRGAGRWSSCACLRSPPGPRPRPRTAAGPRSPTLAPNDTVDRWARRRHPVPERHVDGPGRHRRARLPQGRPGRPPCVRVAPGRRRVHGAGPGRPRPPGRLLPARDRVGAGRAAAAGLRQRRDALRRPGGHRDFAAERARGSVQRRREPVHLDLQLRQGVPGLHRHARRRRRGRESRLLLPGTMGAGVPAAGRQPGRCRRHRRRPRRRDRGRGRRRHRHLGRGRPHLHAPGGHDDAQRRRRAGRSGVVRRLVRGLRRLAVDLRRRRLDIRLRDLPRSSSPTARPFNRGCS